MRPIDADRLKNTLKQLDVESNDIKWKSIVEESIQRIFPQIIDNEPTIEAETVKHAKWEICSDGYYPYCSNCKNEPQSGEMTLFCPNCGARMDGDET